MYEWNCKRTRKIFHIVCWWIFNSLLASTMDFCGLRVKLFRTLHICLTNCWTTGWLSLTDASPRFEVSVPLTDTGSTAWLNYRFSSKIALYCDNRLRYVKTPVHKMTFCLHLQTFFCYIVSLQRKIYNKNILDSLSIHTNIMFPSVFIR